MSLSGSVKLFFRALLIFIACFTAGSCNNSDKTPDVSGIKINLRTARFDKDLYAIDTSHVAEGLQQLLAKYPDFLNYYLDTVMAYNIRGNYNDTVRGIREGLRADLTEKGHIALEDTILKYYPNNKDIDEKLTDAFRFLKYYFPAYPVPKIIYLNMGLSNWPAFQLDSTTFCIGLDMFLGPQYPYYKSIGVPEYMGAHLRKAYIPASVFTQVYRARYPFFADDRTLLDLMIQRGKEQYFLHKVLPSMPDSLLFGFSQLQTNWCAANEALIYNFFIHQNLLYSKDPQSVQPYVHDGPFAKGLESPTDPVKTTPGNIGTWLGYKIVAAYMARHPEVSLQQLCDEKQDPAKLLEEARYKPK
jgi:hypothetical protein